MMIKPTVGRKVWIRNRPESISGAQPEDGTIVYVHNDTHINVGGRDAHGFAFSLTSMPLYQGQGDPPAGIYAEWPYQVRQSSEDKLAAEQLAAGATISP